MIRSLCLAGVAAVAGCGAPAVGAASTTTLAAETSAPAPGYPAAEAAEDEAARRRIRDLMLERQAKQQERAEAVRISGDQAESHTREYWLKLAREVCKPIHCDGGPIDVNCIGGGPPEWARMQAGTEACAKRERQLEKEKTE